MLSLFPFHDTTPEMPLYSASSGFSSLLDIFHQHANFPPLKYPLLTSIFVLWILSHFSPSFYEK